MIACVVIFAVSILVGFLSKLGKIRDAMIMSAFVYLAYCAVLTQLEFMKDLLSYGFLVTILGMMVGVSIRKLLPSHS